MLRKQKNSPQRRRNPLKEKTMASVEFSLAIWQKAPQSTTVPDSKKKVPDSTLIDEYLRGALKNKQRRKLSSLLLLQEDHDNDKGIDVVEWIPPILRNARVWMKWNQMWMRGYSKHFWNFPENSIRKLKVSCDNCMELSGEYIKIVEFLLRVL